MEGGQIVSRRSDIVSSQSWRARPAGHAFLLPTLVCAFCGCLALSGCGDSPGGPDPMEDLPPNPVSLRLVRTGPLADTLEWAQSSENDFARYRVLRLDAPETSPADRAAARTLFEITDVSQTSAIDSTVSPGFEYAYWIEVVDESEQVGLSAPLEISTPRLPFFGIGLSPRQTRVTPGDTLDLTLWIESAPPLFGIAVDLRLPQSLQFLECTPGEFFGTEQISICQAQAGGVGLSWTRLRGSAPVEGFGMLGQIRLRAIDSGDYAIGLERAPGVVDESGTSLRAPEFFGSTILADSMFAEIRSTGVSGNGMHRGERSERRLINP